MTEYEKWVQWVFNCPASTSIPMFTANEQATCFRQSEREPFLLPSAVTIDYLTRLFRHSNEHLHSYSNAQVNEGLWFLVCDDCSSHFLAFLDDDVPLERRLQGVQSIYDLFRDLFATRCTNHLSHLDEQGAAFDEQGASALNLLCYMWWELTPFYGADGKTYSIQIDKTALDVLEQTLFLNNEACIESALHGLGHFVATYPSFSVAIIERFLDKQPLLRWELVEYAYRARTGAVL